MYSLPLSGRDRALGILVAGRHDEKPYDPEDMSFLEQLSKQIGIAVENALAYRQITELTQKLSQEKLYLEDEIRCESMPVENRLAKVIKVYCSVAAIEAAQSTAAAGSRWVRLPSVFCGFVSADTSCRLT